MSTFEDPVFVARRQEKLRREQHPLLLARAQRAHVEGVKIWKEQIKAALRNPVVFLGFCAVVVIAAAGALLEFLR